MNDYRMQLCTGDFIMLLVPLGIAIHGLRLLFAYWPPFWKKNEMLRSTAMQYHYLWLIVAFQILGVFFLIKGVKMHTPSRCHNFAIFFRRLCIVLIGPQKQTIGRISFKFVQWINNFLWTHPAIFYENGCTLTSILCLKEKWRFFLGGGVTRYIQYCIKNCEVRTIYCPR